MANEFFRMRENWYHFQKELTVNKTVVQVFIISLIISSTGLACLRATQVGYATRR